MNGYLSFLNYYQILAFFTFAFGILLSAIVYSASPKSSSNRFFVLLNFLSFSWFTVYYVANFTKESLPFYLLYYRLIYATGSLAGYCANLMVINLFPKIKISDSLKFLYFILAIAGSLSAFLPSFLKGVEPTSWGISPIFGTAKFALFGIILIEIALVFYIILKGYRSLDSKEKVQLSYFTIGFVIFTITSGIFMVILPTFIGPVVKYWYIGILCFPFLLLFTAVAIIKNQTFNVKPVLTDFLVSVFGVALLIIPILSSGLVRILSIILFIFFIAIGYSLVRYTHREVRQKEILEEKVKERTVELQAALDDVQKRKHDLEKFYSLTVGRELKMVELKKKIQDLEEKTMEAKN